IRDKLVTGVQTCALPICNSKICPAFAFLHCHYPILLYLRLKMTVCGGFLPKRINLRITAFFDYLQKARRFHFEELHILAAGMGRQAACGALGGRTYQKKSARELLQGG